MESERIYRESYKYLDEICRQNTTGEIRIDYCQLDEKSRGELKDIINRFVVRRKHEIGRVIFTAK